MKFKKLLSMLLTAVILMTSLPVYSAAAAVGDLNSDGVIDKNDVTLFAQYFAGWPMAEETKGKMLASGDVNGDETVTRADAMELARRVDGWKTTYTVTFEANADGVAGMPEHQKITAGECAVEPDEPVKDGYIFDGWYRTTEYIGTPYDFSEPINENIVLYAKWTHDNSLEYGIGDVAFDEEENTFSVSVNAQHNVNLNIYIQDEDMTTILHQGTVHADISEYLTQISYSPDGYTVPEFFALTITLTDDDNVLLCEPYTTIKFTQRYKESIAKTINDFDEEKVVNLDEKDDTNFMVAGEGVDVVILPDTVYVDYNEETQMYILSGDIDLLDIENSTELIVKDDNTVYLIDVDRITKNDNTIEIIENPYVDYKDFFSYIKINDSAYGVQNTGSEQNPGGFNTSVNSSSVPDIDVDNENELEIKFNKKFEEDGVGCSKYYGEVDLTGSAKAFLRILFDVVLFGEDYIEIEVGFTIDASAKANVGVKIEDNPIGDDELRLGGLSFPFGTSGVFFMADVYIPLDWKISGELEVSADAKYSFKRVYNTLSGWSAVNHDPEASITIDAEARVEMFWGLKVDIGVYFLNQDFISISAPLKAGVMIEAEVKSEFGVSTNGVKHECQLCANGTFYPKIEIAITAKIKINDHLNFVKNIPIKLFDFSNLRKFFYVSLINSEDSVHGGKIKLGFGDCPNVSYKAAFSATDYHGNEYETPLNISGYFYKSDGSSRDYAQPEEQYLPDSVNLFGGYYTASTEIDGICYERQFSVNKSTNKINLLEYTVNGNVLNAETGSGIKDASVTLFLRDGTTLAAFKTGMSSSAGRLDTAKTKFYLPVGYSTIYVKIECDGYSPYYTAFSVPNKKGTLDFGTVRLQKRTMDQSSLSGIIIDSHDKVLPEVQVRLYDSDGNLLYNTLSDTNGVYNIYILLDNGQYTLDFGKNDYSYDNVLPDIIVSGAPVESYSVVTMNECQYTVSGKVTDGTNPLAGVHVAVTGTGDARVKYPSAETASDGTYSFSVPGGTYSLVFTKTDHKSQTRTVTVSGGNVTLPNVVMPMGELEFGIVRGSDDILAMESVKMKNSDSYQETWTISSSADWTLSVDGDWLDVDALSGSAGTADITVSVPEGSDQSREAILTFAAENNSFAVKVIQKAGAFTGTVVGKGAAVAGASVTVYNTGYSKTVTTGSDGTFTCTVPDGSYRVKVSADGFAEREILTRYSMDGTDTAIDEITLYMIISVTGQVSDGTPDGAHYGEMLPGVIVEAFDEETGIRAARAKSDSEGAYTLSFNRPGNFKIRYIRAGYCIVVSDDIPVLEETTFFDPVAMVEDPIIDSGEFGDYEKNLSWTVSSMGTLTISGEGDMYIWLYDPTPWSAYTQNITSVIIDDGVTTIGNHAFECMNSLVYVSIPSTVTYIAHDAFNNCRSLEEIYIPDSVTELGSNVFTDCTALNEVKLSNNITEIPGATFYYCTSLSEITLPSGLQIIGNYAFTFCPMESIKIPDSVTEIGGSAFAHTSLTNITLPSRLEVLGYQVFQWCHELQNLVLPEGLISIGGYAFEDCYEMTSIHIPASVTSIGNYAFDSSSFKSITVDDRNTVYFDDNGVLYSRQDKALLSYPSARENESYTIPEGIETIRTGAFNHAYNLAELILPESLRTIEADSMNIGSEYFKTITIPKNVSSIAEQAFLDNWQLAEILVDPENAVYSSVDGVLVNKQEKMLLCYPCAKAGIFYTIPDWITTIGESAFTSNKLTELTIPNSVTHIRRKAFQNSYITEIHIPASVVSIREDAFGYCYQMTDAYFYGDVPAEWGWNVIPDDATIHYIEGKNGWTSPTWTAPDGKVFNTAAFLSDGTIVSGTSGTCGDNITWKLNNDYSLIVSGTGDMWDYHYESDKLSPWGKYRDKITSIVIEEGITGIGEFAFYYCENVDGTITVPDSVTAIEKCAFEGCKKVDAYSLPGTLKTLAGYVFKENNDLDYINLPDGVTEIGEQTFLACHNLSSIGLPEGIKSIGYWAFGDCYNLKSIDFPESLEKIADAAFWQAGLTGTVTIPAGVSSIGSGAFYGEHISEIVVDSANTHYKSADGVLYNYTMTELMQHPRGKQGEFYEVPYGVTKIWSNAMAQNGNRTVILPETLKEIGNNAFWNTVSLTSIYIPASVEKIGDKVFEYAWSLTGVYFYGNVPASFGENIIANCSENLKLYYISGKSGWTSPTWTAPDGTVYNTAAWTP